MVLLETNYSYQLNELRRLQTVHGDNLTPHAQGIADELQEALKQVDIARQYFKSMYIQAALAQLSRLLLYVGLPAIASALYMLLIYTGAVKMPVAGDSFTVVVAVVIIFGFSPLTILFAFALRLAVVVQRSVAITPFTTPDRQGRYLH